MLNLLVHDILEDASIINQQKRGILAQFVSKGATLPALVEAHLGVHS